MKLPFVLHDRSVQGNFDWLIGRAPYALRAGADSWAFPGGTRSSGAKVVTHGLGRAPLAVFVTTHNRFLVAEVSVVSATTFTTTAMEVDGAAVVASTSGFYWLAVG